MTNKTDTDRTTATRRDRPVEPERDKDRKTDRLTFWIGKGLLQKKKKNPIAVKKAGMWESE